VEWLIEFGRRLATLVRRNQLHRELEDEMRLHRELREQQNIEAGMTPDEAHYAAERRFGNATLLKEASREMWTGTWFEHLIQDLRYGLRQLRRSPGFTAVAVLTLALGIGANTLIFSVVNAAILHPLPFRDANRLVTLWVTGSNFGYTGPGSLTDPDYTEWQKQNRVFSDIAAYRGQPSNLTGAGEPLRLAGAAISPSLFRVLGVNPALGRPFALEEENAGHNHVALLSDKLWRSRFGSDPSAVGKAIKLDGEFYSVVGVMPASFDFPNQADVWVPLTLSSDAHNATLQIVARLKPGVSIERARTDVILIAQRLDEQRDRHRRSGDWDEQTTLVPLGDEVASALRTSLLVLLGAVGLVLVIACANVANLFLGRAATRQREIGIRKALGAGRSRMIRQMLTESGIMAALGGGLGLLLAIMGHRFLAYAAPLLPWNSQSPAATARIAAAEIDFWVLGFTLTVSVLTALLFGLTPALRASRAELTDSLREGDRGSGTGRAGSRLRDSIVLAEVALSVILLVSAGLLIRSFLYLMNVDPGFSPKNVLTMNISLPESRYGDKASMVAFEQQALSRLGALPGVRSAGGVFGLPLGSDGVAGDLTVEGQPAASPGNRPLIAAKKVVGGDYFSVLGIPLIKGRYFDEHDSESAPHVVIISQSLAHHYWPRGDALGRRLKPGFSNDAWCTVVGIVADTKQYSLDETPSPSMYLPYGQASATFWMEDITLVVRTVLQPLSLVQAARHAVESVDPDLPVFNVVTMEQLIYRSASAPRFNTVLLGIFASLALILAAIGIYGVMSYAVTQRTHEIGVRMALGAKARDVLGQVIAQGMRRALAGIALGLAGALILTRFLASLLYSVRPVDPATYLTVSLLLLAVALLACYVPARRAATVDPMIALRHE
jgi:putative ABC transport system permease protein